eukprot:TRINITY_DN6556_c0_g1_i1.p1 TRINITY_DN6556_c0_g1~~TRINITY_DN6556_c0_g1_i1.p1  ORF type:complete len:241 (-),score=50.46 TRINITY_DN6556_c0_g1_i1:706-1428(-)
MGDYFFFFSSRRRHTRSCLVSWARRCVQETDHMLKSSLHSNNSQRGNSSNNQMYPTYNFQLQAIYNSTRKQDEDRQNQLKHTTITNCLPTQEPPEIIKKYLLSLDNEGAKQNSQLPSERQTKGEKSVENSKNELESKPCSKDGIESVSSQRQQNGNNATQKDTSNNNLLKQKLEKLKYQKNSSHPIHTSNDYTKSKQQSQLQFKQQQLQSQQEQKKFQSLFQAIKQSRKQVKSHIVRERF